jgi:hypothetical protein
MRHHLVSPVDPFDLPDWLGTEPATWTAESSVGGTHLVAGSLVGPDALRQPCDVLAGDLAHPAPVLDDRWRTAAHQAWSLGELLLLEYDGRLTLVVPGSTVSAEPVLEALRRLTKAVGAPSDRITVSFRL